MSKKHHSKNNVHTLNIENEDRGTNKRNKVLILPRNLSQENYVLNLANPNKRIVVAVGPAGTGKTLLAVLQAIKEFKEGKVNKIIITRPTVAVANEQLGFLPGNLNQKMEPWTKPIFDIFEEYYNPKQIMDMVANNVIEVCPLAMMRGRTFKDAIIISDETQNTTPEQLLMLLTRMGEGSRTFVTGDIRQSDIRSNNGLNDFLEKVGNGTKTIGVCRFAKKDIERDPIVSEILNIYGEE